MSLVRGNLLDYVNSSILLSSRAEEVGFEPTKPLRAHAFQACAIDHYATPPRKNVLYCTMNNWLYSEVEGAI